MWVKNGFILVLIGLVSGALAEGALLSELSTHPLWLNLYQYRSHSLYRFQKNEILFRSDVTSKEFFFSPQGRESPLDEMKAAIKAFQSPGVLFGAMKKPAACVFPARLRILKQLLSLDFPPVPCLDYLKWKSTLNATQAHLVYVGAYSGNPASIVGHTFLRLFNQQRESKGQEGIDLLSYSVAFLARTLPEEERLTLMWKGLTGGYKGYYDLEPFYMKVGLYNNSESRDLWEVPLDLTTDEMDLLVDLIWEYAFNAEIPYYFIDDNCSYRLLRLLDVVRPHLQLNKKMEAIVLPAETVRLWRTVQPSNSPLKFRLKFRASVKRRLDYKYNKLTDREKRQFIKAQKDLETTQHTSDPKVLDALMEYWLYENYKVQTHLPPHKSQLMEAAFRQMASSSSHQIQWVRDNDILHEEQPVPPFLGHRPHWWEGEGGRSNIGFSYRWGLHPLWSSDPAFRDIVHMEYLGGGIYYDDSLKKTFWNLALVQVQNFENFFDTNGTTSWLFHAEVVPLTPSCPDGQPSLKIDGGWGLSLRVPSFLLAVLPQMTLGSCLSPGLIGYWAPSVQAVSQWTYHSWSWAMTLSRYWFESQKKDFKPWDQWDVRWGYRFNEDRMALVKWATYPGNEKSRWAMSFVQFF